jgi:hypothetical protein
MMHLLARRTIGFLKLDVIWSLEFMALGRIGWHLELEREGSERKRHYWYFTVGYGVRKVIAFG